jgi:hypothetical protein
MATTPLSGLRNDDGCSPMVLAASLGVGDTFMKASAVALKMS